MNIDPELRTFSEIRTLTPEELEKIGALEKATAVAAERDMLEQMQRDLERAGYRKV
jgi:hypothetical protein